MTPIDVFLKLQELGIQVQVQGESLSLSQPRDSLPADLRQAIDARESELVAFLAQMTRTAAAPARGIERVSGDRPVPLSFGQERFWFLSQFEDASAYNLLAPLRLRGRLDVAALERSLGEIVRRHDALRTTVQVVDDQAVQCVAEPGPLKLPVVDLSDCEDPRGEEKRILAAAMKAPFDFSGSPLYELTLYRLPADEHLLVVKMHHMLGDRHSFGAFFHELDLLYRAAVTGGTAALPQLPVQYADYAAWQRSWYERESRDVVAYWKKQLAGVPLLELPTDRPRPQRQTFGGAARGFVVERRVGADLEALAKREGCTLFMVLLAAFDVLLARHSGQEDVVLGTPVAGRDKTELEPLIGLFVNMLALRADLSGRPTFRELLRRVREVSLGAFQHQEMPFEQLVVELEPERDVSRNPIFQVMFNLLGEDHGLVLGDLDAEIPDHDVEATQLDLSLWVYQRKAGLSGRFEYNVDLFDAATIERFEQHFARLLAEIGKDPDRCVWELPMLTAAERPVPQAERARTPYPDVCLHTLIEEQVARTPDAIAVEAGGQTLTYRELNARANQLAHHLRRLGAEPESLVGLSVERSIYMPIGMLGILKSGAAYVPMDPAYPADRLAFMLEDAGAALFVTQASVAASLPGVVKPVLLDADEEVLATQSDDNPENRTTPRSLAHIIYSSGSTGRPKGALIEHRSLVNAMIAFCDRPGITADDTLIAVSNIAFDLAGLDVYLPLVAGARIVIASREEVADGTLLGALIRERGGTFMDATPSTWRLLVESGWRGEPGLRCVAGGEVVPRDLAEKLAATCRDVWECYGPCETTIYSTRYPFVAGGPMSAGKPLPNTTVVVLDGHGQPVPIGATGEIYLGGDGVARGYHDRVELTAERFVRDPLSDDERDRLYRTGDLARWLPDGNLQIAGRADTQIKLRGFRIELGEIEHVLRDQAQVRECAVVARSRPDRNVELVGFVVLQPDAQVTANDLRAALREKVPEYMLPAGFVFLDELPLTPNGKVDRVKLTTGGQAIAVVQQEWVAPTTTTEKALAAIWKSALGVERVGLRDKFFELGGHSLLAMKVVFRIEREIGQRRSPMDLLTLDLGQLADACQKGERDAGPPIVPVPRDGSLLPSSGQQRFWFLWQLEVDSAAYNVVLPLRLRGSLDAAALRWSFDEIVRRHEALRTTFAEVDGRLELVIGEPGEALLREVDVAGHAAPEAEALRRVYAEMGAPFDLSNGPMFRFVLMRLAADDHVLTVTTHHAAMDEWSIGLLCRELAQLYEARQQGLPSPLPELPVQYADYAQWQRRWCDEESAAALAYWKKQLAGVATLELPTDRPRPPEQTFAGTVWNFEVPRPVADALKELGHAEGCTFFMSMLAAFQVLLARYTGQEDVVVGTPVANRRSAATEPLIGLFLNTLVLRTDLGGSPTFRTALRRVRDVALGAFEHQDLPFEQLVVELRPERDLSRTPLFQVLFQSTEPWSGLSLGEAEADPLPLEAVSAKFDLTLGVSDAGDRVHAGIEYNRALFDAATIERLGRHLLQLLEEIARDPDRCLWDLPLLTADERQKLLVDRNRTAREYAAERCYHQLFEAQVERAPDRVAVRCDGASLTYAELNARANQLAHHLRELGACPEKLIGVSIERSLDMPVALLGILKSGAAYVPLDPAYPNDRLSFIMEDAGIELLVTQETLRSVLPEQLPKLVRLDTDAAAIAARSVDNVDASAGARSLAYVIFTSGSTGKPKGVQIEHRALVNFLTTMADRPGFVADDVLVAVTTISFDIAGLELCLPLLVGGQLVIAGGGAEADGGKLADLLDESGATVMQATPATWHLLLESGWRGRPDMKVLCGGEALPRDLAEQLILRCSELWNMYGPTETTIWSLVGRVESGEGQVPIGAPIANTEIYLLDARHQPVPIGVAGELYLGGDGLARGYWNRPDLTAEKFIVHPFKGGERLYNTGDLARYRADGTIEFLGRIDHQVKIRGFRIELGEIEHVLARHDAVGECAVVVHTKRSGEKQLVAHLVFVEGRSALPEQLQAFLRESLPDYMVPPLFDARDELPLTPNGKIDRKALMASEVSRLGAGDDHVPPRTATEKLVAEIWSDVLEVERVGRNDNFFDLGGHSLLIMQLRRRLQEALDIDMGIGKVFQYPTVAAMGEYLSAGEVKPVFEAVQQRVTRRRAAVQDEAIAIIGMAGRFPGARDLSEYWNNLRDGVESLSTFTDEELLASGVAAEAIGDAAYVRRRGIVDDIDLFDAAFFQIPAREAEAMDPQQRLFLECAWQALEGAGYDPYHTPGAVSVYAGSLPNTYLHHNVNRSGLFDPSQDFQIFLNNYGGGFLATRVAYKLNLRGSAVEVQTACSTSLVAVAQACQALLGHQCEMALAGGVALGVPQRVGYLYEEGLILSPDGRCRPFDANGRGTLGGEGVGVVLLKRLSDAIADGDHIRAVIRGAATNNDGSNKVGFTAPSVEGQAEVIAAALAQSGTDPETIDYVEAHGTATPLGDPIEVAALTRAFRASTDKSGFCVLGAVKSNFGHADAAAGVAGLIKTVLALEHRQMPPTLHFEKPNPELGIEDSPFVVSAELREWAADETPRRAGVSSFGFGGTNAHVVLEEAPAAPVPAPAPAPAAQVLVISAKTEGALEAAIANLTVHLAAHPEQELADIAHTTQQSRAGLRRRRAVVCRSAAGAIDALSGESTGGVFSGVQGAEDPPVVFMFSGQGAQYPGMGRELYESEPVFRQHVDRCAELLEPHLGLDLRTVLFPDDAASEQASEQLSQTWLTQPAIFAIEYALAQQWIHLGVRPAGMIGHSVGEFVAATLAGVFSLEDALRLVAARGRMMQDLPAGDMLSVSLPEEKVLPWLEDGLSLAAVNSPAACVVSGPSAAVAKLQARLDESDLPCRMLHTSHAFHSSMMEPIVDEFAAMVREVGPQPAQSPCVSTVTGTWIDPEDWADPAYWARNLREPVRFSAGVTELLSEDDRVLLEVGPGQTLSLLVRQHGRDAVRRTVLASMPHVREKVSGLEYALSTLARLWIAGVPVNWIGLHAGARRRRVPLPTYPFERQSYWVEPAVGAGVATVAPAAVAKSPDLADWFLAPLWKQTLSPPAVVAPEASDWLVLADEFGLGAALAERLASGARVVEVRVASGFRKLDAEHYEIRPDAREDYDALLEGLRADGITPARVAHLWSVVSDESAPASLETLASTQARGFYSLLFLAQALGEKLAGQSVRIEVVTNDLFGVLGREAVHPERATVLGPCRVIPLEYPDLGCRTVDLELVASTAHPDHVIERLLAEWSSDLGDPVVAFRGEHRWVPTYEPARLGEAPAPNPKLHRGGVYLITGGLGGIGQVFAEHLAKTVQAKLVLIGRSGLPERDRWAAWIAEHGAEDRTSRRIRQVQALEQHGAEVLVAAADVAELAQMEQVMVQVRARFGAVHGVIHAAGLATGGMIALRTAEQAAEVLDPKVRGTLVLSRLLAEEPLEFFALCSSINSVVGNLGASDYCGANAFLDALAHSSDLGSGAPFVAINWDTWSDVGMAVEADLSAEQRRQREADLAMGIGSGEGVEALDRILARGLRHVAVCPRGVSRLQPSPADAGAAAPDQAPSELTRHARPDLPTDYIAPTGDVEIAIAEIVQDLLGLERVGAHDNFFELGFDSLVAHRMMLRLTERLDVEFTVRTILESLTVAALGKYVKAMQWAAN